MTGHNLQPDDSAVRFGIWARCRYPTVLRLGQPRSVSPNMFGPESVKKAVPVGPHTEMLCPSVANRLKTELHLSAMAWFRNLALSASLAVIVTQTDATAAAAKDAISFN